MFAMCLLFQEKVKNLGKFFLLMRKRKEKGKHLSRTKERREKGNTLRLIHTVLIQTLIFLLQRLTLIQIPNLIPTLQVLLVMEGVGRSGERDNVGKRRAIVERREGVGVVDDQDAG